MIPRGSSRRIESLAHQFPVVVITGPRQAGKTTVIRAMYPNTPYINLERPDTLSQALDDPKGFLDRYQDSPLILDEAQRWPQLASWLQVLVDEAPTPGRFFLTGSNQPLLRANVSQSLSGRAAYLHQAPFDSSELLKSNQTYAETPLDQWLVQGFYPPLYDRPFEPVDWLSQYVQTYLERDLSQLLQVKDSRSFHHFLQICAGRSGQILNMSDLARDADISHTTAKQWLSVLEASFLVFFLQPWHNNMQKRIVKSPKLYFWDVGLASHLCGIHSTRQMLNHPLRGALYETMVVADLIKKSLYTNPPVEWYFWSAAQGPEVDLVRLQGGELRAIEIKSSKTFKPEHLKNLQTFSQLAKLPSASLELRYGGEESFVHQETAIRPWWE